MNEFRFQVLEMRPSTPLEWLTRWKKRYEDEIKDDPEYRALIERHPLSSADDFRRVGKWKDGATTAGRWRPNVASVAFPIWERAAEESPTCPEESGVAAFLEDWSTREYTDTYKNGPQKKHFGLSRATSLLHFVS